jgi:hypothetical protein
MWPKVRLRVDAFFSTSPEPLPHPPAPSIFIPIIFINLQIALPATPFFSHLYKSPRGYPTPGSYQLRSALSTTYYQLYFHWVTSSFAHLQNSSAVFSIGCGLFTKKCRGGSTTGGSLYPYIFRPSRSAQISAICGNLRVNSSGLVSDVATFGRSDVRTIFDA